VICGRKAQPSFGGGWHIWRNAMNNLKNTELVYFYRDGVNEKTYGSIVFIGIPSEGIERAREIIKSCLLHDGIQFNADQINIPELRIRCDALEDHCWHEFEYLQMIVQPPTDERTIDQFLKEVEIIGKNGWKEYDVVQRATGNLLVNISTPDIEILSKAKNTLVKTQMFPALNRIHLELIKKKRME